MTPSTTFQWPLSPSGTFQPDRSWPLKSETKPSGTSLSPAPALTTSVDTRKATARAIQRMRCMAQSPRAIQVQCFQLVSPTVASLLLDGEKCKGIDSPFARILPTAEGTPRAKTPSFYPLRPATYRLIGDADEDPTRSPRPPRGDPSAMLAKMRVSRPPWLCAPMV